MRNKRREREIWWVLLAATVLVITAIIDFCRIDLPDIMVNTVDDHGSLFVTLFSVQASMAALSIAIVSILNGTTNSVFYAISVSRYITEMRPALLTHKRVIELNILITVVNYFAVSKWLFNISIALFCVSMGLNWALIVDSYTIFGGLVSIKKEIRKYVLQKYDVAYLDDLANELHIAIRDGNSDLFEDDTAVIQEIFHVEIVSNNPKSEILNRLEKVACDGIEQAVYAHNSSKIKGMFELIISLCEMSIKHGKSNLASDMWWKIRYMYFKGLKEIPAQELLETEVCIRIHDMLCDIDDEKVNLDIPNYAVNVYWAIGNNRANNSQDELDRMKAVLYSHVHWSVIKAYRADSISGNSKHFSRADELCQLNRVLVYNGEFDLLHNEFFVRAYLNSSIDYLNFTYLMTVLYLYYILCREALVAGKQLKKNAEKLMSANYGNIRGFYRKINIIKIISEYKTNIFEIAKKWEYFENLQFKCLQMEEVTCDFLIFSLLKADPIHFDNNVSLVITESYYSIYNRYFSTGEDDKYITDLYTEFCQYFAPKNTTIERNIKSNIALLKNVMDQKYKGECMQEATERQFRASDITIFKEQLEKKISLAVNEMFSLYKIKNDDTAVRIMTEDRRFICSVLVGPPLDAELLDGIFDFAVPYFAALFIRLASKKNLVVVKYNTDDNDKQEKFLKLTSELGLKPDTVMGQYNNFWFEKDRTKLERFTEKMHTIEFNGGYDELALIDSSKVEFQFTDIHVELYELSQKEIEEYCRKDEEGNIHYNIVNGIYLPFTQEEIKDYSRKQHKKVVIKADLQYRFLANKVGTLMKVE